MMRKFLLCLLASTLFLTAQAQDKDVAIANQYYQNGSFQKASELYEQLIKKYPTNDAFYNNLFRCYLNLKEYDEAEKLVKKQIKKRKGNPRYEVDLGYLYTTQGQLEKAEEVFNAAIDALPMDDRSVRLLASGFTIYRQDDYVIKTYEQGNKLFSDPTRYSYELGNAYRSKGDAPKMVSNYLYYLDKHPEREQQIKNLIMGSRNVEEAYRALEKELYARIQKSRDESDLVFNEMLIWLFIQQKDFESALVQAKALDRRLKEEGFRILEIARMATTETQFEDAIQAYTYLMETDRMSSIKLTARTELLNTRKQKIDAQQPINAEDLRVLEQAYEDFLREYGKNQSTVTTMHELAELKAYYLDKLPEAIKLTDEIVRMLGISPKQKNAYKLDLGDFYVMSGDVWEATLIYFQVDKAERDSPIGEMARYKNARLSYYKGEFEWAQAQLKILKGSTTELISNDAIELSVFITDNLGLDTSSDAMIRFAKAELLVLQNKDREAMQIFETIEFNYPGHKLTDDILFAKARIEAGNGNFQEASQLLHKLLTDHKEDLLGDNATFMLAKLYEEQLGNPELAMEHYKSILMDYKDSVYTVEARKRFRALRGDNL